MRESPPLAPCGTRNTSPIRIFHAELFCIVVPKHFRESIYPGFLLSKQDSTEERCASFLHCGLFRVDALRPGLGRSFGQRRFRAKRKINSASNPKSRARLSFIAPASPSCPPSVGLRSAPAHRTTVFVPLPREVKNKNSWLRRNRG
jgi:hypothetical protein